MYITEELLLTLLAIADMLLFTKRYEPIVKLGWQYLSIKDQRVGTLAVELQKGMGNYLLNVKML